MSTDKEEPKAPKPSVAVGTIGHLGHGKTTLAAALTRVCSEAFGAARAFDKDDSKTEEKARGIPINADHVVYDSAVRHYTHLDFPDPADYLKTMTTGALRIDGAILVCSASEGPTSETRDHVRLARQVGVPNIVVFLTKADLVDDAEMLELIEMEVRELLSAHEYSGDDTPIIIGSAKAALRGSEYEIGIPAIKKLVEALDSSIPGPVAS